MVKKLSYAAVLFGLLLALLSCAALADSSGDWQYTLNDEGQAIVTRYCGNAQDVKMPWQLGGHVIVEIGEDAFADCTRLKTVSLPVGVTILRMGAFRNCTQLQAVTLPERLETIEDEAFLGCTALTKVRIPDSVAEMGESCFESGVTLVGTENSLAQPYAEACKLAFELEVSEQEKPKNAADNYQYRIQDGCAVITSYLGEESVVIVPSELDGLPVIGIGTNAFSSRYSVERVVLPEGLLFLERTAFRYCPAMYAIEFPSTLVSIGEYAFYRCERLDDVVLPDGLTELGSRAFQGCSALRRVTIPASVTSIPYYTFFECHASLTICAPKGSAAERFAYSKGYRFTATD